MLPTLVFDLDGTLIDSARDLMETLNVILAREGVPPFPVEAARGLLGAGARALIERGLAANGRSISPERLETLFRDFLDHYEAHIADHTVVFPGVGEALARLQDRGFPMAVCTNKMEHHAKLVLRLLDLQGPFSDIVGRDTFAFCKPDPRHLTETVRRIGGDPARAIMIGDSRTDADTATRAGLPCVLVSFGYTDQPAVTLGATTVIDHFDALAASVEAIRASRWPD